MFLDLAERRRSIRKFTDEPVDIKDMDLIAEAALNAPSAMNRRPVEFVMVRDPKTLALLSELKPVGSAPLAGAALAIAVLADTEKGRGTYVHDAAIAAITMQYAAADRGLGSCWIHVDGARTQDGIESAEYVRKLLDVPDRYYVGCVLAVGHPAETPTARKERADSPRHDERFGQ